MTTVSQTRGGVSSATVDGSSCTTVNAGILDSLLSQSFLAIVDQAIVSGTNFLMAVALGRAAGMSDLGLYSLAFSCLVVAQAVNESLVCLPYAIRRHRLGALAESQLVGSGLQWTCGWTLLAALVVLFAMPETGFFRGSQQLSTTMALFALALPLVVLREFVRRTLIARLFMLQALVVDGTAALVQFVCIGTALSIGMLSAEFAILSLSAGALCASVAGIYLLRKGISVDVPHAFRAWRSNWNLGKWILAGRVTSLGQAYAIPWLIAWFSDLRSVGGFAACMTVLAVSNPLLMGLGSLLTPRFAQTLHGSGVRDLRRLITEVDRWLLPATGLFCLLLGMFGSQTMDLVFGSKYVDQGTTLLLLAAALFASVFGMTADNGLRALERPQWNFVASTVGLSITLGIAVGLVPIYGNVGGALGLLVGSAFSNSIRRLAFKLNTSEVQ